MAIYRCEVKNISRGAGRSAVAAAAYASAGKLQSEYDGQIRDFEKKSGVLYSEIMLPEGANEEFYNREKLWNAVEKAETAENARLAKELVIALPHELTLEQNIDVVERFAKRFVHDYGVGVDFSIHGGAKENGGKNDHAHVLITNRAFDKSGELAKFKERKEYARDKDGNKIPVLDKDGNQKIGARGRKMWKRVTVQDNPLNKQENLEKWRADLAYEINMALSRAGIDETVDHRSYARQGVDRVPQYKEGPAATAMRLRGKLTKIARMNEQIQLVNCFRSALYRRDGEPRYEDDWSKRVWAKVEKQEQEQRKAQLSEQKPRLDYKQAINKVGGTEVRKAVKRLLGKQSRGLQLRDLTEIAKLLEFEESRNGVQALPPADTLSSSNNEISGLDWLLMNEFQREELERKAMLREL